MQKIRIKLIQLSLVSIYYVGILWISLPVAMAEDDKKNILNLESITVTAQKREENVQIVTSSTSVISDVVIEDAGILATRDLRGQIPNFKSSHGGSRDYFSRISIRGISNSGIGDPAVALYIDDISYADVYAFDMPLYDIERIEVLKGPQGTLYGKNTEGGAVNVVTKEPTNTSESKVILKAGTYNFISLDAIINAPLIEDTLFFRLAGSKSSHDGYIKNIYTNTDIDSQDTISGRFSLIYKPTNRLDLNLTHSSNKFTDDGGFPMVPMDTDKYKTATKVSGLDDFEAAYNYDGESSTENQTTSLRAKYDGNMVDLVSITALRNMDNASTMDGDFTPSDLYVGFNAWKSESLSQEIRIQSKSADESLKWLLGFYYCNDKVENKTGYKLGSIYAQMMGVPVMTENTMAATLKAKNTAVFGETTMRLMENKLGATAGIRFEKSERGMDRTHTLGSTNVVDPMTGLEKNHSIALPKAALDYRIDDDIMVYLSAAKGYKAGGYSYAVDDTNMVEFEPEISNAIELGLKSDFPDKGVRLNIALFTTAVDDYQDRVQINPTTIVQANATEVDIYGLEAELTVLITDTLTLNSIFGYTKAKYSDYIDPVSGENYKDKNVVLTPEYNFGMFLEHRRESGLFSRLELQNTGSSYFDRANEKKQDPYSLINIKVGYETKDWDLYLSAKNLTNKQYFLDAFEDSTVGYMGTVGDPRTVNVAYNHRF